MYRHGRGFKYHHRKSKKVLTDDDYIFLGQFFQESNAITFLSAIDNNHEIGSTCDNVLPGDWNIWVRQHKEKTREIIISRCDGDISEDFDLALIKPNSYQWQDTIKVPGQVMMTIDHDFFHEKYLGVLGSLKHIVLFHSGFIVFNVPNIRECKISLAVKNGRVYGMRIKYCP